MRARLKAALDLVEAAEAIRLGHTTSTDLTNGLLQRIEGRNPDLNAFIDIYRDSALATATLADRRVELGNPIGPLHGVPLAHKDIFSRAGFSNTHGTDHRRPIAGQTARCLRELDDAGAIDLGRLNMSEFALGPSGTNCHHGNVRNPHRLNRIAGGSSSGSAAAVAAGLAYGALGSDTAGSLRIPAGFCGVVTMKPSSSLVSVHGTMPLAPSLDAVGPIAATVRGVARLLDVLVGQHQAREPASAPYRGRFEHAVSSEAHGVATVAVPAQLHSFRVAKTILAAIEETIRLLAVSAGISVVKVSIDFEEATRLARTIVAYEAAERYQALAYSDRSVSLCPDVLTRIRQGLELPRSTYLDALQRRPRITEKFEESVFSKADALLLPLSPVQPPSLRSILLRRRIAPGLLLKEYSRITAFTAPINYFDLPAMTLPTGLLIRGTPVGFQLIGSRNGERALLGFAQSCESGLSCSQA